MGTFAETISNYRKQPHNIHHQILLRLYATPRKSNENSSHEQKLRKRDLNQLLNNYRDTPHPATGLAPAAMLFRDGKRTVFPRKFVADSDV